MSALPPILNSLNYDGKTLSATWAPQEGDPTIKFRMGLFIAGAPTPTQSQDFMGFQGDLTPQQALDPGALNTVAIAGIDSAGNVGEYCPPAQIILTGPALGAVSYDGATVTASWTDPSGYAISGTTLTVYQDGNYYASATATDVSGSVPVPGRLPAGHTYTLVANALIGSSSSPASNTVTLITVPPVLTKVTFDGKTVTGVADGTTGQLLLTLLCGGTTIGTTQGAAPSVSLAPKAALIAGQQYTVTVTSTQGNVTGPPGVPQPVLVGVPIVRSLAYDGVSLSIDWRPAPGVWPVATGAQVLVQPGNVTLSVSSTEAQVKQPLTDASYTVQVSATCGISVGPASTQAVVPTQAPAVATTAYDGAQVQATWNAIAGATAYRVGLFLGNAPVASQLADGSATSSTLPAVLGPGVNYAVKVQALATTGLTEAAGPWGAATAVLSATAAIAAVTYDGSGLSASWGAVTQSGVTGYTAALYTGDTLVQNFTCTTNSLPITPVVLKNWQEYRLRIVATGAGMTGPMGLASGVITAAPAIESAGYDGTRVQLRWSAVAQGAVTGYKVSLLQTGGASVTKQTNANSLRIDGALDDTKPWTATVQAVGNVAVGPVSEPSTVFAVQPGYYFATPGEGVTAAYIYRAAVRPPAAAAITLWLPDLFTADVATPIVSDPFTLAKSSNTNFKYSITVPADSVAWKFDAASRQALRTAYQKLLTEIEAAGPKPGALAEVRQALAQALPVTYDESLYYAYGYDNMNGYVNLQPGMRVRFDAEVRQFVGNNPMRPTMNGFVPGGTFYAEIGAYMRQGRLQTGFNGFFSRALWNIVTPSTGGGGGLIDLYAAGSQWSYFRLFYPSLLFNSDVQGNPTPSGNVCIVGANTYGDLEAYTAAFLQNQQFPGGVPVMWLRGRATAVPELQVSLNGSSVHVPLGTTLRQLLSASTGLPYQAGGKIGQLSFQRSTGGLVNQPSDLVSAYSVGRTNDVYFEYPVMPVYADGSDCFDLPLLAGDVVSFGAAR